MLDAARWALGAKQQALDSDRQATGADQSASYAGRRALKDAETKCLRVQMPRPMTNAVLSCPMKVIRHRALGAHGACTQSLGAAGAFEG